MDGPRCSRPRRTPSSGTSGRPRPTTAGIGGPPSGATPTTCPTTPSSPATRTVTWSCSGVGTGTGRRGLAHLADHAQQRLERPGVLSARRLPVRGAVPDAGRPPLAVAQNADGRLEVFAPAGGGPTGRNTLWHLWQTAANNGWSDPVVRGHDVTSPPAVGRNATVGSRCSPSARTATSGTCGRPRRTTAGRRPARYPLCPLGVASNSTVICAWLTIAARSTPPIVSPNSVGGRRPVQSPHRTWPEMGPSF